MRQQSEVWASVGQSTYVYIKPSWLVFETLKDEVANLWCMGSLNADWLGRTLGLLEFSTA